MHILFCGFANFLKVIYRIFFKEDIFHKIISLMQKKAGYKYQLSRGMTHVNKSRQPRKSKIWLTISSLSLFLPYVAISNSFYMAPTILR